MQKGYPCRACRVAMDTVDTVGVGAKRSTHTVSQQIWVVGTITFSAKRSTHAVDTVDAVNMGGGDI